MSLPAHLSIHIAKNMEFRKVVLFPFPFFLQLDECIGFYRKPLEDVLEAIVRNYCSYSTIGTECLDIFMDGFRIRLDKTLKPIEKSDDQQGGDPRQQHMTSSPHRFTSE